MFQKPARLKEQRNSKNLGLLEARPPSQADLMGGAYSRMFAPEYGVREDPATGSSTGPLALFMMTHGLMSAASGTRFISEQGTKMERRSILHVRIAGDLGADGIYVGGHVTPVAEGTMEL